MSDRNSRGNDAPAGDGQAPEAAPRKVRRRTVIKSGVAIGAAAVLTSRKSLAQDYPPPPPPPPGPQLCGTTAPTSPPTTPFVDNLPIPQAEAPTFLFPAPTKNANIGAGEAARAAHQRWEQFLPQVHFHSIATPALHRFHSDLLPSYLWTFNGVYPGRTILVEYGKPAIVRFRNNLPAQNATFGVNELTVHLHNGHTPSESDGFAGDFYSTGFWKDNHYPNVFAGVDQFGGIGDPREGMSTFWYHDHRAAFTANNNYLGLNGMLFMRSFVDPGHENPTQFSWRLPGIYGLTDIPMILADKRFCPAADGRNELFQVIGSGAPGGDKWIINGKIQPKMTVRRRKYRFRFLDTSAAKAWNLTLVKPDGTQAPMTIVSADGNTVATPIVLADRPLQLWPALRMDVVIDFAAYPAGTKLYLREAAAQNVGVSVPDPAPGLPIGNVVMRFDVVNKESWFPNDTPPIPSVLTQMPDPIVPQGSFQWEFTLVSGQFLVNGLPFDHNRVDHVVLKGSAEEWTLANDVAAGNWTHPVHIHFEEGRIMSRRVRVSQNPDVFENVALLPEETGKRDVYVLPPQNRLVIRLRFRDFVGRYLIHCHNMNHEDDFMMARWDIVDSLSELTSKRREIDERRIMAGLPPQYGNKNGGLV
jgi:FtsP/CotA-like multicopper oxidase with cupredoxin domain